jgi:hypothetical protein
MCIVCDYHSFSSYIYLLFPSWLSVRVSLSKKMFQYASISLRTNLIKINLPLQENQ